VSPNGAEEAARYAEALSRLQRVQRFGVRLGLERVSRVLEQLGHPERAYPTMHIAGTNGKGSTSAMLAACLRCAGYRTGLFTSPHLQRYTERIQIDGAEIPRGQIAELLTELLAIAPELTFFELATVAAARHFAARGVDCAVFETGLGGRLDATAVLQPEVAVLTSIDYDHVDVLGSTLGDIAAEKAGIIKPGTPTVAAPGPPPVTEAIARRCAAVGAPLRWVRPGKELQTRGPREIDVQTGAWHLRGLELSLGGAHQHQNAALCVAALERLAAAKLPVDERAVRAGLVATRWPGRLEVLPGGFLVDCAHNPAGTRALAAALPPGDHCLIFGCLADRPAGELLEPLAPRCRRIVLTGVRSPRGADPRALRVAPVLAGRRVDVTASLREALALVADEPPTKLICGSIYLVGEARALLLGEPEDPLDVGDPLGAAR
jgi:dihydrofolate synthase/folylpolyglutamate synthase